MPAPPTPPVALSIAPPRAVPPAALGVGPLSVPFTKIVTVPPPDAPPSPLPPAPFASTSPEPV